jgi:superfamily II DNA or RNA helicase
MEIKQFDVVYVYTTDVKEPLNRVKIGKTTKNALSKEDAANIRIKEQFTAGNRDEKTKLLHVFDVTDTQYTAYQVESFIHKQLHKDNVGGEWFEVSLNRVIATFNKLITGIERPNVYPMRNEQQNAVNQTFKYFINTGDEFLWNAKMRFGKTFASYQLVKKMNASKVLILTYKPAVVNGWKKDLNNHVAFADYTFYHALELNSKSKLLDKSILFASFQDILGKNLDGTIKSKWKKLLKVKYDLIIIDEVHYGASSKLATDLIYSLKYSKFLALSGTPIKLLSSGTFTDDNTYTWSYIDEQETRKAEVDTEIYKWLPDMQFYTYKVDPSVIEKMIYFEDKEKLTLNKFFSSDDGITFNNSAAVERWLDLLSEEEPRCFNSPFNNNKFVNKLDHLFWMFDTVNSVKAMAKTLRDHHYFKQYEMIVAADDNEGEGKDTLEIVQTAIYKFPKTITLSCGKLNTGITVPEWNAVFMLNDTKAVETYMQTIFRVQTANEEDNKLSCYVFDFNPDRTLEMIYNYAENIAKANDSTISTLRRYLETIKVFAYEENELITQDINSILKAATQPENSIKKFSSERLINSNNVDEEINSILQKMEEAKVVKQSTIISENNVKGKTFEKADKKSNKKKILNSDDQKIIIAKAITLTKRLPRYLYNCNIKPNNINDLIKKANEKDFLIDMGIEVKEFKVFLKCINEAVLNRAIEAFKYYEETKAFKNIEGRINMLQYLNSPSSDEIYTPHKLVCEVLDKLPKETWSNPNLTFCDPCMKSGIWLGEIFIRCMDGLSHIINSEEKREAHILKNMIYGYALNTAALRTANKVLWGSVNSPINLKVFDVLTEDENMKFDVVIGNPPFQDNSKIAKNSALWEFFIDITFIKLIKPNGYVGFITPTSWMNGGGSQKQKIYQYFVKYKMLYLNLDIKKYFAEGSQFSGWVIQNTIGNNTTVVVSNNEVYNINFANMILIPKILNNLTINIIKKVIFNHKNKLIFSKNKRTKVVSKGKYIIYHGSNKMSTSNILAKNSSIKKVIFSLTGYIYPKYDNGQYGTSPNVLWVEVKNEKEGLFYVKVLESKLMRLIILKICKYSGFNSIMLAKNLPFIPYIENVTDQDLYKYFNLTKEEIDYIEANI